MWHVFTFVIGVYPGSFDPLTIAHVALADAARERLDLVQLDLAMSRVALGKNHGDQRRLDDRVSAIEAAAQERPWLQARITDAGLVADVALGYDAVIMGADKWHQLFDIAFYDGSFDARDGALGRLPVVAVAPRLGHPLPDLSTAAALGISVVLLDLDPELQQVSATAVRAGRADWRA